MYTAAKTAFLTGGIDLVNDTIKAALIDTADYTFSASHEDMDDVGATAVVAEGTLAGKSVVGGVFDANDVTLSNVSGDSVEAVILYKDAGGGSTLLICYIDTGDGFPLTPNGGQVDIVWDNGANKIFSL